MTDCVYFFFLFFIVFGFRQTQPHAFNKLLLLLLLIISFKTVNYKKSSTVNYQKRYSKSQ